MKKNIFNLAIMATFVLALASCKKDPVTPTPTPEAKPGQVSVLMINTVGDSILKMNGTVYKNQNGDDFTVSKFNYYISNIKFIKNGVITFTESNSYHLIEQSDEASLKFTINNVPAGTYDSVRFTVGVDSLRNVSGAQTGALDPVKGMFWSWSTGYIMLKLEGTSPQSTQAGNSFQFHAGGFKGTNNVLRDVTLPLYISINGNVKPINIIANIQKMLANPNLIDFSKTSVIMSAGANANALADNYQKMFTTLIAIE